MSPVDLTVREGIPQTGVYTSDQGAVYATDSNLALLRIERAWLRVNNGVAVYRETGLRHGTTYAGTPRVVGQITRAFINMAELRLALGLEPGSIEDVPIGPGVLTGSQLAAFMGQNKPFPYHAANRNWYPPRVDIGVAVNAEEELSVIDASAEMQTNVLSSGIAQTLFAKGCIINTYALVFDARGLITSGPMDFLGSSARWRNEPSVG